MLTIEELEKRIDRDQELLEQLAKERRRVKMRLFRYKKSFTALLELEQMIEDQHEC